MKKLLVILSLLVMVGCSTFKDIRDVTSNETIEKVSTTVTSVPLTLDERADLLNAKVFYTAMRDKWDPANGTLSGLVTNFKELQADYTRVLEEYKVVHGIVEANAASYSVESLTYLREVDEQLRSLHSTLKYTTSISEAAHVITLATKLAMKAI